MKKLKLSVILLSGLLFAASCKNDDDNVVTVPEQDRNFAVMATDANLFEIQAGQLAQTKGARQDVKNFGQMMVTDHTKSTEELMGIATPKNITLPTTLSTEKRQKYDSLNAVTGQAFDRMYARMMVTSHQQTINLFETQSNQGGDTELKSWATGKLPALRTHLQGAQTLRDSVERAAMPTTPTTTTGNQ
ncbi:DUF4142 domain-containing protein [Telluribacter sp. SYSU D00476]|uniref:DUF4142 domain-containing protein n=1 Tax=Telluribacter sp. SYSU D00476 TaxID=2811430 RepID=UPI001FF5AA63|nr:DUF4142 domain-containing protein [Telluribacter sp. SYSU D00476]